MKIYSVDNTRCLNFSALRMDKRYAKEYLSRTGKKNLESVDKVGELIKDTKYYHLIIGQEMYISNNIGGKMYAPYTVQNAGSSLLIGHKQGYLKVNKKIPFNNNIEAKKAEEKIKAATSQIERTGYIVKYLDEYEKTISAQKEPVQINERDKTEEKINKLIEKYGI